MGLDPMTIAGGAQLVGGLLGRSSAKSAASGYEALARAQIESAKIAAEEARFRPIGITTRFGSATPEFNEEGRLSGYTYEASPEVIAFQDQLARLYSGALGQAEQATALQPQFQQAAQGLFNLGQQYIPQSQEQVVAEQMALLRPYDIEEEQRLAATTFGRGRGGLSIGVSGSPDLKALAEARARRNAQIAASAPELLATRAKQAADLYTQGAGLFGTGYQTQQASLAPFMSQFGAAQQLEETAQQPMQIGAALGAKSAQFGGQAAQIMQGGANAAANLQAQAIDARAAGRAGLGAGIANVGMMYGMNQMPQGIGGGIPGLMGFTASGNPYAYGARGTGGGYSS